MKKDTSGREVLFALALAAVTLYVSDDEVRAGVNQLIGGLVYRARVIRWWNRLAGWQQEDHNQRFGRDPLLQPQTVKMPRWWGRDWPDADE